MNRPARHYVLLVLGLAGCLAGGLALFNLIIDPFNRFGLNHLGVYISAERECKSVYVKRFPHDALLIGNSRAARIPPGSLEGFTFFNAAFSGATSEEAYYFLQHFARHQRLVILTVDVGMGDPVERQGDIFAPQGLTSALDNLLNLQTTGYSIRTLSEAYSRHPDPIGLDGAAPIFDWMRNADQGDPKKTAFLIESLQRVWGDYHCPPMEQMSFYVKINECLRQRAIPCVVVIPPMHEAVARVIQGGSAAAEVAAWKRQLGAIFPHVIDLSFSSYSAATNFYRSDPVHFKPEVGIRFMNREVVPFAAQILRETSPSPANK